MISSTQSVALFRRAMLFIACVFCLFGYSKARGDVTLFDNTTGTASLGSYIVGLYPPAYVGEPDQSYEIGFNFTVPNGPAFTLKSASLVVSLDPNLTGGSSKNMTVQLHSDNLGTPGIALETWTVSNLSTAPAIIQLASASHATLSAGQQYWLTSSMNDSAATGDWYTPAYSDVGLDAASLNGGPFSAGPLPRGAFSITGAFSSGSGSSTSFSGPTTTAGAYHNTGLVDYTGNSTWTVGGDFNADDGSSLTVGDSATLQVQGNFNGGASGLGLEAGTALGVAGSFTNGGVTTFNTNSTVTVGSVLTNNSTLVSDAHIAADSIDNNSSIQSTGVIELSKNFTNEQGATLTLNQGSLNAVELDFYKESAVNAVNNASISAGTVNNAGAVQLGQGSTLNADTVNNTGSLNVGPGTVFAPVTGRATLVNEGAASSARLDGATHADINNNGGTMSGDGTVYGDVSNAGDFAPGDPVTFQINGDYSQSAAGSLTMEIDGTDPSVPDFDQLFVSDQATLDGTLDVTLGSSYTPAVGDSFEILTYGSLSGNFADSNLPPLASGEQWSESYGSNGLTLSVVAAVPEPTNLWPVLLIGAAVLRPLRGRFA
jgi:hypothetical protein